MPYPLALDPTPAVPWTAAIRRKAARVAIDTAARLRAMGCQVLGCHAINGRPWLRVAIPAHLDAASRARILAQRWALPATIEFKGDR
jgi:hypothetical protein